MSNVTSKLEDGVLTIFISGKIDTVSSPEIEAGIDREKEGKPFGEVVLDFSDVAYVSSSGLRVILRLKKAVKNVTIINASAEVYSVLEMTGFTEMIKVEKALRKISVEGCEILGQGAKGTVYRYNPDTIVKVYRGNVDMADAIRERELARKAFILGVPTAISFDIVKVEDTFGSMFELLDCESLTKLLNKDDGKFDEYVSIYAELLRNIHEIEVDDSIPSFKDAAYRWLSDAREVLGSSYEAVKKLLDEVPESHTLLHCDCHTNNIMMMNGEALLIDMDTLSRGNVCFELANIYTAYVAFGDADPSMVERFMGVSFDLAGRIWKAFLPKYLGSDDKDFIEEQENKIKLLSYLRIIRHYARRNPEEGSIGARAIASAKEKVSELITKVSSLTM